MTNREIEKILLKLETIYTLHEKLVKEEKDFLGNTNYPKIAERIKKAIDERFGNEIYRRRRLSFHARNLIGHDPQRKPSGQVLENYELATHGFKSHKEVPQDYHVKLHLGLADIMAGLLIAEKRRRLKAELTRGIKKKTNDVDLGTILFNLSERRDIENTFAHIRAIARYYINCVTMGSGSPSRIGRIENSTYEKELDAIPYTKHMKIKG